MLFFIESDEINDGELSEEGSGVEEDSNEDEDGYRTITFLLKHHDWEDLLQDFTDNNLKVCTMTLVHNV